MGETTLISWADSTFNPVYGCTRVSVGAQGACVNCYAASWAKRYGHDVWEDKPRQRTSVANWKLPLKWNKNAAEFQRLHGHRQRVFCASLADVFDNKWELGWRADLFDLIYQTPDLDWLLLTKRIGNAADMIEQAIRLGAGRQKSRWPWSHVWLGETVVTQEEYDRDWPKLRDTPAAMRFLSIEPMMGPIKLHGSQAIDWILCGGESGSHARPMHPEWARSLRDQCIAAGIPFHLKQIGEWTHVPTVEDSRNIPPDELRYFKDIDASFRKVGKHIAGRALDGRTWNQFPESAR